MRRSASSGGSAGLTVTVREVWTATKRRDTAKMAAHRGTTEQAACLVSMSEDLHYFGLPTVPAKM